MLSPKKRKKMGNPIAIKADKTERKATGQKASNEDYGLYKNFNYENGVRVRANEGIHDRPNIVLEFPITTPLRSLSKTLAEITKYYQGLECRTTLKGNKVIYKTYRDDQRNYGLETALGKFYFIRDAIIRSLFKHYRTKKMNKASSIFRIGNDLSKLSLKMFGLKSQTKKRELIYLSPEAIRKILAIKPTWEHPEDFPQYIQGDFILIQSRIFKKLRLPN